MIKHCFRSVLIVFAVAAGLQGQGREALLQNVDATAEWSLSGEPAQYDETNIESFSQDLAPLLKNYGFEGVTLQNWQGASGEMRSTLFEMIDASAAYGFFSLRRRAERPLLVHTPIGTESFQAGNRLYFWQSNFVVRIDGEPASAHSLAKAMAENILGRSEKPPVSSHLPPGNLIGDSETYILDPAEIGNAFGVPASALGFEDSAEAATATYRVNDETVQLLLLLYPTQHLAKKYADQLDDATGPSPFRKRAVRLFAIAAGTSDEAAALSILDQVNYESKVTWNEPLPDLNMGQVLVTIFTFTGIALVLTLVAGVGFGGLRLFVKSRYPDQVFDRRQDMEIIQLRLGQGVRRDELGE